MKKIFSLIAVLVLLSGCDDGDMTFKTFDFSEQNVQFCTVTTGIISYKLNTTTNEALIVELADGALINSENINPTTGKNELRTITISATGSNRVTYRNYKSLPGNICNSLTNGTTGDEEVWRGVGELSVFTSAVKDQKTDKILSYKHLITLKNITFTNGEESITVNDNPYGTITIENGFTFNFASGTNEVPGPPAVYNCTNSDLLFNFKDTNALIIDVANFATTFPLAAGSNTVEFTNSSGTTANRLTFTVYNGQLNIGRLCDSGGVTTSPNPVEGKRWIAEKGTLVVETTFGTGNAYSSNIYLKDIIFRNIDKSTESFNLNDIVVVTEKGYFFGTYIH